MGNSIGIPELIVVGLAGFIVVAVQAARAGAGGMGPALVLRTFLVDPSAVELIPIQIRGRASGVVAWLLTTMGLSVEWTLTVTAQDLTIHGRSLSGEHFHVVPLRQVSSAHCAYSRPIAALGVALLLFALSAGMLLFGALSGGVTAGTGFSGAALIPFGLGLLFLLSYWLSKKVMISVATSGARVFGLTFKPSVIEHVNVDFSKASQAIFLLNRLVLQAQPASGGANAGRAAAQGPASSMTLDAPGLQAIYCRQCGTRNELTSPRCRACGAPL
jgi:hypothetical protein